MLKILQLFAIIHFISAQNLTAPYQEPNEGKIVGGTAARIESRPFQVSLQHLRSHICGGSIIASNLILTAAHCVQLNQVPFYQIRAGSATWRSGGVTMGVKSAKIHPKYSSRTIDNDVAILELTGNIPYDTRIQPIKIPSKNLVAQDGANLVVSGWGTTRSGVNIIPGRLRSAIVPVVNMIVCESQYGEEVITPRMICAGKTKRTPAKEIQRRSPQLIFKFQVKIIIFREIFFITFVICVFVQDTASTDPKPDKGRIVGGEPVDIKYRPFQGALYVGGAFCGGSIIATNKFLTAAHCVKDKAAKDSLVYVGSTSRNSGGYIHNVSRISVHPSYNPTRSNDFDVAVLTVTSPFRYSTNIQPIGLLSTRPTAGYAVVSGWGSIRSGGSVETYLRQVVVPIVSQAQCRSQYGTSTITNNMICAGFPSGGKDSCQGDSGGPLTINGQLVGVVSFGNGCALPGYAGVYASVPDLRSWIVSQ